MAVASAAAARSGGAAKRKRTANPISSNKRARSEGSSSGDEEMSDGDDGVNGIASKILLLEAEILQSKKNYNNIAKLLDIASKGTLGKEAVDDDGAADDQEDLRPVAVVSLCRAFIRLLAAGNLAGKRGIPEKELMVIYWLKDRLAEFKAILLDLVLDDDLGSTALTLSVRLIKAETEQPTEDDKTDYSFPKLFFTDIVANMLRGETTKRLSQEFLETFVTPYDDIRFHTFKAVNDIYRRSTKESAEDSSPAPPFMATFNLLSAIDDVPPTDAKFEDFYLSPPKKKSHAVYSVSTHKKHAQDAWLGLLNTDLTNDQRKQALKVMSDTIAPWFTKPELLMDFLTDCYDAGGSMSLLALSGVFYLIQERNLDYPAFYSKLYSLLDASMLSSKHRSRFFRLMDTFLNSSHLPAQLVASFIKRLARLCLYAPPSATVTVVPWMYNMFKKHPLCTFMLHRVPRSEEEKESYDEEGMEDPFVAEEEDPMKTGAIESCLWEVVQLQGHWHPNVATIARILSEQFTKQFYNLEDFLDHSYKSLLDAEMVKDVKKPPVVEFQIPKRIFLPQEKVSGVEDSLLVKLWDFS